MWWQQRLDKCQAAFRRAGILRNDPARGGTGEWSPALPRADEMPLFDVDSHEVPTTVNPLGAKGVGEAGTVGALPALLNAVNHALAPLGIRHLDMPLTPERVWQAMRNGSR